MLLSETPRFPVPRPAGVPRRHLVPPACAAGRAFVLILVGLVLSGPRLLAQESIRVPFSFFPGPALESQVKKAFLPADFNNWGNNTDGRISSADPSRMIWHPESREYRYETTLEVGRTYTYKIHYHRNDSGTDYVWMSDPLNDKVTGPNNDSVLELEPLTIFQPARLLNAEGRIDTVRAWILATAPVLSVTFEINGTEQGGYPFYHMGSGLFRYGLSEPVAAGSQFKLRVTDAMGRSAEVEVGVITPNVEEIPVPAGLVEGFNPHPSDPTRGTLVLHAPNKGFVHVIGDFNEWKIGDGYVMKRDPDGPRGTRFWLELEGLTPGVEYAYQYLVDGSLRIADPFTEKVLSPDDSFIPQEIYPALMPYPDGKTAHAVSVLQTGIESHAWTIEKVDRPRQERLVIYELLVRDFLDRHDWATLTDTLDYLQRLGINAIELMPVQEFEGNSSWGYNPAFYFAPDKAYGPAADLKRFVDACHARGIAVILDLVMNHSFGQSPLVRLYNEGGYGPPTPDNPWYNVTATHPFSVGYDFNHESLDTQALLDRVTAYWLKEYRVDGYRFDLSKGFTQKQTGTDVSRWSTYDAGRVALLKRMADAIWAVDSAAYVILEHFADLREERELAAHGVSEGRPGMLVWHNMNRAYSQSAMGYLNDSRFSSNLSDVHFRNRGFDRPSQVSYMESHDEQWLMYRLRAYGNRLADYDIRSVPIALERMKLSGAFFFLVPGPKMIWQFGELGYGYGPGGLDCLREGDALGECPSGTPGRTAEKPVRWDYLDDPWRVKLYRTWSALLRLRNSHEAFTSADTDVEMRVGQGVADRRIRLRLDDFNAIILGNFGTGPRSVSPDFPEEGWWYEYFSGDSLQVSVTAESLELLPGEFRIYTTSRFAPPEPDLITVGTEQPSVPGSAFTFALEPGYPNPFVRSTTLGYVLPEPGHVTLEVFDVLGRRVARLVDDPRPAGRHEVLWDAAGLSSGTYLVRLRANEQGATVKLSVAR